MVSGVLAAAPHLAHHVSWAGYAAVMILVNGLAGAATVVVCSSRFSSPGVSLRVSFFMLLTLVSVYSLLVTAIFLTET